MFAKSAVRFRLILAEVIEEVLPFCTSPTLRTRAKNEMSFGQSYSKKDLKLEMWANAKRDGRPAEYRWRPLFNAAKLG